MSVCTKTLKLKPKELIIIINKIKRSYDSVEQHETCEKANHLILFRFSFTLSYFVLFLYVFPNYLEMKLNAESMHLHFYSQWFAIEYELNAYKSISREKKKQSDYLHAITKTFLSLKFDILNYLFRMMEFNLIFWFIQQQELLSCRCLRKIQLICFVVEFLSLHLCRTLSKCVSFNGMRELWNTVMSHTLPRLDLLLLIFIWFDLFELNDLRSGVCCEVFLGSLISKKEVTCIRLTHAMRLLPIQLLTKCFRWKVKKKTKFSQTKRQ